MPHKFYPKGPPCGRSLLFLAKRGHFLLLLLVLSGSLSSQVDRSWTVGLGFQAEAIFGQQAPLVPADQLFPVHPDAAHYEDTVNFNGLKAPLRIDLRKRLKSWFSLGLMVNALTPGNSGSTQLYPEGYSAGAYRNRRTVSWQNGTRVGQYRQVDVQVDAEDESLGKEESSWGLCPYALFDLKMKDPDASFSILLGFEYQLYRLIDRIHLQSFGRDANNLPYVDRSYGINRRVTSLGLIAGLEWQDYFGERWGYAVGLRLSPWARAFTTEVERASLIIKGVPVAMEELRYNPSNNDDFPREKWNALTGGLTHSVFYRFKI